MNKNKAFKIVKKELARAQTKFSAYNSAHEGYAVILEELDELWDEIKLNRDTLYADEATQVAATAIRFLIDVCK